jgi:hypothetical protein
MHTFRWYMVNLNAKIDPPPPLKAHFELEMEIFKCQIEAAANNNKDISRSTLTSRIGDVYFSH